MISSWSRSTLGELCDVVKGKTAIKRSSPGDYPLVTTGLVRGTADHYQFDDEVVCVPLISSTGHGHASLKRVHFQSGKFALANLLAGLVVRDRSRLLPRFLGSYLNYYKDQLIVPLMVGAANMSLTVGRLATVPVAFPSVAVQEQILERLHQVEQLQRFRDDADERAHDLVPAIFFRTFGDVINDSRWPKVKIADVGEVQLGRQRSPQYQTGLHTRPYVRVANVFEDRIDVTDLLAMDFDEADFAAYKLEYGDILLNEGQSTELVGRPAMWRNEVSDCCFQNTLIRFRCDRCRVDPEYALAVFLTYLRRGEFARISSKTSNVAHLGAGRFAKMSFPVPPIDLQQQFTGRLRAVRELQSSQESSAHLVRELRDTLTQRAFTGALNRSRSQGSVKARGE